MKTKDMMVVEEQIHHMLWGETNTLALLLSHKIGLFELIAREKRISLAEICDNLKLAPRPVQALLSMCMNNKLIVFSKGYYSLTKEAAIYLVKDSHLYWGKIFDMRIMIDELYSFKNFEAAFRADSPQIELFGNDKKFDFTPIMHAKSMVTGMVWPDKVDFSSHKCLLDIGGGSGAHSIGACTRWKNLKAIIFDFPDVCELAKEFIANHNLQNRIHTGNGDMWKDDFPEADIHFYSDILHDWPPEKGKFLIQKSFDSLDHKGRIVILERLFNKDKSGPFSAAAYNTIMMILTRGQQFSDGEMLHLLKEAGFIQIEIIPLLNEFSIVSGIKA